MKKIEFEITDKDYKIIKKVAESESKTVEEFSQSLLYKILRHKTARFVRSLN